MKINGINFFKSFPSPVPVEDIPEAKKAKKLSAAEKREANSLKKLLEEQNVTFFDNRDFLANKLPKSNWIQLLEVNKQELPKTDVEVSIF